MEKKNKKSWSDIKSFLKSNLIGCLLLSSLTAPSWQTLEGWRTLQHGSRGGGAARGTQGRSLSETADAPTPPAPLTPKKNQENLSFT